MSGHYRLRTAGTETEITRDNAEALILAGLCRLRGRDGDVRTLEFCQDVAESSRTRLSVMAEAGDEMRFRVEIDARGADYDTNLILGGKRAYAINERLYAVHMDPETKIASYPPVDDLEHAVRPTLIFSGKRCWSQMPWRGPRPMDYLLHPVLSKSAVRAGGVERWEDLPWI